MADSDTEVGPDAAGRTRDADAHGRSANQRRSRSTPEGEIRTQRGRPDEVPPELLKQGHETQDVSPRSVFYALIGIFAFLALSAAFVFGILVLYRNTQARRPVSPLAARDLVPPQPRLEVAP